MHASHFCTDLSLHIIILVTLLFLALFTFSHLQPLQIKVLIRPGITVAHQVQLQLVRPLWQIELELALQPFLDGYLFDGIQRFTRGVTDDNPP